MAFSSFLSIDQPAGANARFGSPSPDGLLLARFLLSILEIIHLSSLVVRAFIPVCVCAYYYPPLPFLTLAFCAPLSLMSHITLVVVGGGIFFHPSLFPSSLHLASGNQTPTFTTTPPHPYSYQKHDVWWHCCCCCCVRPPPPSSPQHS